MKKEISDARRGSDDGMESDLMVSFVERRRIGSAKVVVDYLKMMMICCPMFDEALLAATWSGSCDCAICRIGNR